MLDIHAAGVDCTAQKMDTEMAGEIIVIYLAAPMWHTVHRCGNPAASDLNNDPLALPTPPAAIYFFHDGRIICRQGLGVHMAAAFSTLHVKGCAGIYVCYLGSGIHRKYFVHFLPHEQGTVGLANFLPV